MENDWVFQQQSRVAQCSSKRVLRYTDTLEIAIKSLQESKSPGNDLIVGYW